jgi:hypothetical protein
MGSPAKGRTFIGRVKVDSTMDLKAGVSVVELVVEGKVPDEQATFEHKTAILLDLDYIRSWESPSGPFALTRAGAKDFMRSAWEHGKSARDRLDKLLRESAN